MIKIKVIPVLTSLLMLLFLLFIGSIIGIGWYVKNSGHVQGLTNQVDSLVKLTDSLKWEVHKYKWISNVNPNR